MKFPVAFCLLFLAAAVAAADGKQKDARTSPKHRPSAVEKAAASVAAGATSPNGRKTEITAPLSPGAFVLGTVSQWRARAEERYPDLKSPASIFSLTFDDTYKVTQHDDPAFLMANDWPLRLAHIVAQKLVGSASAPLAAARR